MTIWKIIGTSAACLTMFGFIPQAVKVIRTKSAGDVSLMTLVQFTLGVTCWLIYGVHLRDPIIIVANAVTLVSLCCLLGLYFKYR